MLTPTATSARSLVQRLNLGGRVMRNSAYLFGANTVAKLLAFLLNMLIIWGMSDEDFGIYRWVVAFVGIFANLVDLGLLRVGVRSIARSPDQACEVFRGLCRTKAVLSIFSAGLLVVTVEFFLHSIDQFATIRILSYIWFLVVVVHVMRKNHEAVFLGLERMGWTALFLITNRFLTLAFVAVFLLFSKDIIALFVVFLLVDVIDLIGQWVAMRRLMRLELDAIQRAHLERLAEAGREPEPPARRTLGQWIREGLPFGLQELTAEIYMRIDSVMLGILLSHTAVSDYNKAYLILTSVLVLPNAISQAVFPRLSEMQRRDPDEMRRYFRRSYLLMIALGPFVMAGMMVAAPLVLTAMKGNTPEVTLVYVVAMSSLPLYFLTMPLSYFLGAVDRQVYVTCVSVIMALFNITVNFYLIPDFGPLGAATATILTEALALALFSAFLQRHYPGLFDLRGLVQLAAIHAAMLLMMWGAWQVGYWAMVPALLLYGAATLAILTRLRISHAPPSPTTPATHGGA